METAAALRWAVVVCVALRAAIVAIETVAFVEYLVVEHAVDVFARQKEVLAVPRWVLASHLWFEANLSTAIFAIAAMFLLVLFILLVLVAADVWADRGSEPLASLAPLALLVPYANLVLPWVGVDCAVCGRARRVGDEPSGLHLPTIGFATVFATKMILDAFLRSSDIQPDLVHWRSNQLSDAFLLYREHVFSYGIDLASAAVFLAVFVLYWRWFLRVRSEGSARRRHAAARSAF